MKVVINKCYGGFSLSAKAVKRMAELNGKECYFFTSAMSIPPKFTPVSIEEIGNSMFWIALSIPNPEDFLYSEKSWHDMTMEERAAFNKKFKDIDLDCRPENRSDPVLIQTVEELGGEANGACAKLSIVEIPDNVEYEIDEYGGIETVHEKHRSWNQCLTPKQHPKDQPPPM